MSRIYSISTIIDLKFNEKNISEILSKGINIGLRYYEPNFEIDDPFSLKEINLNETVQRASTIIKNDINVIEVRLNNTFFSMFFYKEMQLIEITFSGFSYFPWMRTFKHDNEEDLDIARYLKLLLNLIENYKILSLKIDKE